MSANELGMLFLALLSICLFIVFAFTRHTPISKYDLDLETCEQARAAGWSEEEIEKFMHDNNSHYCPKD